MGLIKAFVGALGGTTADQWREYFYCNSLSADTLVAKGQKRVSGRSSNRKGEENIISNGSVIAVNEGQCMIIVEQGKVTELCAEAGEFLYDSSTEPSIFYGGLGKGILDSFKTIGKRFTFGGDTAKDQRVYFFNTKEIMGNKYGTPNPVPFRVVDRNVGLDVDIAIRCHGEYSYKITDPILFYTNVCGNVASVYDRSEIDGQLKSELMTALQPAFAKISDMGIRYSALPGHTVEMAEALNEVLSEKWSKARGISVFFHRYQLGYGVGRRRKDDQGAPAQRGIPQSDDGGGDARRRAGAGDAGCGKEHRRRRRVHGLCRHEYGKCGGRYERARSVCDGRSAAGVRTGGSLDGFRFVEVRVRNGQFGQVLLRVRETAAGTGGSMEMRMRCGEYR